MNRIIGQYFSAEMAALCLIEWALTSVVIYAVLISAVGPDAAEPFARAGVVNVSVLLALTIGSVAVTIGLYRSEICLQRGRLLVNAGITGVLAFPALLLVSETLHVHPHGGLLVWLGKSLIAWVACLFVTRWVFSFTMRHRMFVRRVVVLGTGREAAGTRDQIQSHRGKFFEVVNSDLILRPSVATGTSDPGLLARTRENRIWGIVVASGPEPAGSEVAETEIGGSGLGGSGLGGNSGVLAASVLLDLKLRGVRVFDEMGFWEQHLGRINLQRADAQWLIFADGFSSSRLGDLLKRGMDILITLGMLCLTLPLMLLTALLIKLDSPGPVFYRQVRAGLHGQSFVLFKFRSMSVDAEAGGRPRWASQQDPRITRVGGFIRSTRIDELPQLLNVLNGEMSFVGPRPERPHFVEQLSQIIPFYLERNYVKPGLTGWAQVNFPYGASVEDARQKLSYDLYYVKNRSLFLDIVILFSTVRVILFREGAR